MTDPEVIDQAQLPTSETVSELLSWRPANGVLSVYVDADPADRGGRWRIELRNGLQRAAEAAGEAADASAAAEATARRLERALLAEPGETAARTLIGFAQIDRGDPEVRWYSAQLPLGRTEVLYGPRPQVGPLVALLDEGAPVGVAVVSAERVRLFHSFLGRLEQLHDWELELLSLDWRERKAPVSRDPGAGQMVSSAGRDQYEQRLESNRERFAHQTGGLARESARKYDWPQVLSFGDERYVRKFEEGLAGDCELRQIESADLIGLPTDKISDRVGARRPALNRSRERELIERVKDAAFGEARSALGKQETLQALEEGRVEHLLFDAEGEQGDIEQMIELAVTTGAAITPVEEESAAELSDQGGVAALLRY